MRQALAEQRDFLRFAQDDPLAFTAIVRVALRRSKPRITSFIRELARGRGTVVDDHLWVEIARSVVTNPVLNGMRQADRNLSRLADLIPEQLIVLFVGAGVSTRTEFGWNTIIGALAQCLDQPFDLTKKQLEENFYRPFQRLREKKRAQDFQQILSKYLLGPGPAAPNRTHRLIASLIEQQRVEHVVCFNWDNFIERQYRGANHLDIVHRGETRRPKSGFWKPHGCVTRVDIPWVLPCDAVDIPPQFKSCVAERNVRCVLSLGFRPRPGFTRKDLASWFPPNTPIFDVRPDVESDSALGIPIAHTAEYVLERIMTVLGGSTT